MQRYEVTIRHRTSGDRWSMMFWAEGFDHALEQANQESTDGSLEYYNPNQEEIIRIDKDYGVADTTA